MLEGYLILALSLSLLIIVLIMVSTRIGISSPIILVIAGLFISLLPGLPIIRLRHELLFIVLLPPLLYRAAWNTCWHEFWANRRPILLHGFGLVFATTAFVGVLAHLLIPNFPLALGFMLGSLVAPPDALAATAIFQKLKLPTRIVTILEGESLVNDAASLMLFRFTVTAILSGTFSALDFGRAIVVTSVIGILVGLAIAGLVSLIHRLMPTTPSIDTLVSLMTPYLMYLAAEHVGASGVLAVVSGGFALSYHSQRMLKSASRLQMLGVWETLVFLLNGLVFILIGLQLPLLVSHLSRAGISLPVAIGFGLLISLAVIVVRMLWMFPATYLPRLLSRRLRDQSPYPGWRVVVLLGWCGMRGIVTLASALTMPMLLSDQSPFPFRTLIMFIAFTVIIVTLVVQGLPLPWLIRWLNITPTEPDSSREAEVELNTRLAKTALTHILGHYRHESVTLVPFTHQRRKYERLTHTGGYPLESPPDSNSPTASTLRRYQEMKIEMIRVRRQELARLRSQNAYSDELLRRKEFELDLEQITIRRPNSTT